MQKKYPLVSIVIISWNNQHNIKTCLNYIKQQSYPLSQIEIINVDGGSTDKTTQLVKSYVKYFHNVQIIKTNIKDQEPKRAIGILKAHGNYICSIDPDVFISNPSWLGQMIAPLEADDRLIGSQTLYYEYQKDETLINRYFALFGINDPVVLYLGKADRVPHYLSRWIFPSDSRDCGDYYHVKFEQDIPTMGANGVVFRRQAYLNTGFTENTFFHIDVVADMVRLGMNEFAIVKNSVWHSTGSTFWRSITKRIDYMNVHYVDRQHQRRYLLFDLRNSQDKVNLLKFIFFTVTLVQPIYLSIKGYLKKPDIAWFLHLPMCLGFLMGYGMAVVKTSLSSRR